MNWPFFFSTFCLIFFAELGDKTQLAIMGQSAVSPCKWTILWASALALATSTALAVSAGGLIRRFVQLDCLLRGAGGILFLIFGITMVSQSVRDIRSRLRASRTPPLPPAADVTPAEVPSAWLGRFVIRQTEIIERSAMFDYRRLAAAALDPEEKAAFTHMSEEGKWRGEAMLCALACGSGRDIPFTKEMAGRLPPPGAMIARASRSDDSLGEAIRHERLMTQFYGVLSETVEDSRLGGIFRALKTAGENNALRLEKIRRKKKAADAGGAAE